MAAVLDVSLDYLVGSTDLKLDSEITKKIVGIQKLPEEERPHLFFVLDNELQNTRTKVAFVKKENLTEVRLVVLQYGFEVRKLQIAACILVLYILRTAGDLIRSL